MVILFVCLLFGIALMLLLLKNMTGNVKGDFNAGGARKVRMILKLILLVEDAIFIAIFVIVLIKTLFL